MTYQAFDIQGLDDVLDRLQALPKEVVQKRGGPVRKVARNAVHIIRDQARRNMERIIAAPNMRTLPDGSRIPSGDDKTTGRMVKSIRTVKGRSHKTLNGERYMMLIPRRARYPVSQRTPTGMPVAMVGRMLEYGTARRQPMPWSRPAFHAKKMEAVRFVQRQLPIEIDKVVKQLARKKK